MTPFWLDHLLVVVLAVFFPIRASTFGYRRLTIAPLDEVDAVRRSLYRQAIALQWGFAAFVALLWMARARDWLSLGLVPRGAAGLWAGLAGAAVLGAVLWRVRSRARRDPEALHAYLGKLRHLERMLPHTRRELHLFYAVAVTAGVCEELLYRGYFLWYLGHWMGPWLAVAVSSLAFGVGHAYQGWKGVLATGLVGVVMALVYLACGSLWPAIALHALTDIHAGALSHSALTQASVTPGTEDQAASEPKEEPAGGA